MKRFLSVIIGVIVGVSAAALVGYGKQNFAAYGAVTFWDEAVAYGDVFDWNDVFNPVSQGEDLYKMVYTKLFVRPDNDALKEVAQKYGLTKDEVQRIVDGSITPIYNNLARSPRLTQEDALLLYNNLQEDYAELSELFALEQEIDVELQPSEIFSNGDLSDSGFDLIHDLSIIEEILFVEKADVSVGGTFDGALDSPYQPTADDQPDLSFIPDEGEAAVLTGGSFLESGAVSENAAGETVVQLGNEEIQVDLLEEEVCTEDESSLGAVLAEFENNEANKAEPVVAPEEGSSAAGETAGETVGASETTVESVPAPKAVRDESGYVQAAEAGSWGSQWCPQINGTGAFAGSTFGSHGFDSLGNIVSSLINQAAVAAASYETGGFGVQLAVCLDTELVFKRYSTFQPGDSCIACEVDKINDFMDQTLYHSLIPNKVTGNLFESAKCKESYQTLLDMQLVTIGAPVPTEGNDDLIFGKNTFEEWNKFVERYEPFLGLEPLYSDNFLTEFELESAPADTTISDVLNDVNAIRASQEAEAVTGVKNFTRSNVGTNTMLYSQILLGEIKQMSAFFEHFEDLFREIDVNACQDIINKPFIDG